MTSVRASRLATVFGLAALLGLAACDLFAPAPTADFDVLPVVVYAGETVTLDASAASGDLVDYAWAIGDAGSASGQHVTTTFSEPGVYAVRLTVADGQGRVDSLTRELTVYVRSGTRVFYEDFSNGEDELGSWPLDPSWASASESQIQYVTGEPGYCLYVHSAEETLNRRGTALTLPPLRVGQKVSFSFRVMTVHTQGSYAFTVAPGRSPFDLPATGFPYFVFSNDDGGSSLHEPSAYGSETTRAIGFRPSAYQWHTYVLTYGEDEYTLAVDGTLWFTGEMEADVAGDGGTSWIILGDESRTEACWTYFDTIVVTVEE